jgi:hypothetical protein
MSGTAQTTPTVDALNGDLVSRPRYLIECNEERQGFNVVGPDGQVCLSIYLGASGPVLELAGSGLTIRTAGSLAFAAEQVEIHGRDGVLIRSNGDAKLDVAGDLSLRACTQNLTADLGNVNIRANDDVTMNGERIRMNC